MRHSAVSLFLLLQRITPLLVEKSSKTRLLIFCPVVCYHKYPRNWHIANSLMREISRHHRDKLDEYKALFYELCERILKECPDSVMRRSAVTSACMVCDEDEIEGWISRDTEFL